MTSQDSDLAPIEIVIKSRGDLKILDQPIRVDKTSVRRILSVCLCKVSIASNETANTKWWLSMPMPIKNNIKHLNIAFSKKDHSELLKTPDLFQDFNSLESCRICLTDDDFRPYLSKKPRPPINDFLSLLCRKKGLKSLELDMSEITIGRKTLTMLLNQITINEPSRWYLKVLLLGGNERYPIDVKKIKTILNSLDFLGLSASRISVSRNAEVYGYEPNPTDDLSNMKHLTQNRKRILHLTFDDGAVEDLELKPLLDRCIALKGLYISSIGSCFEVNKKIGIPKKKARDTEAEDSSGENSDVKTWASNLEDVIFSFNENTGYGNDSLDYLLPVLQEQSRNLRSLETFFCNSRDDCDNSDQSRGANIDSGREDDIEMHIRGFEQFTSLQELKLTSDGSDILSLKPVLESLINLKKLHLELGVGSKKQDAWDHDFPFKHCQNLQELKIVIHRDMKTLPWGNDFIKNCDYLESLHVLEISDQAKPMPLRTFCSLVKTLMDFKNLRKMIVKTKVANSFISQAPEELEEQVKFSLYALLERLEAQVKGYIHSNRNLEQLEIGKLEGFNLKYF